MLVEGILEGHGKYSTSTRFLDVAALESSLGSVGVLLE